MNEETLLPTEAGDSVPAESAAVEVEATDPEVVSGSVVSTYDELLAIQEVLSGESTEATETTPLYVPEETIAETVAPVTVDVIEAAAWDISCSTLFSGFLICGTLVGTALLRRIHGT